MVVCIIGTHIIAFHKVRPYNVNSVVRRIKGTIPILKTEVGKGYASLYSVAEKRFRQIFPSV